MYIKGVIVVMHSIEDYTPFVMNIYIYAGLF
jgi:hypothetical protein